MLSDALNWFFGNNEYLLPYSEDSCLKFKSAVVSEGMWYSESKETFPNYSII